MKRSMIYYAGAGALVLSMLTSSASLTWARADSPTFSAPLAYVDGSGNVLLEAAGTTTATAVTQDANFSLGATTQPTHNYTHLRWSPDGTKLLFQDSITKSIFVAAAGANPAMIASNVAVEYPASWLPDNSGIVYAVDTQQTSSDLKFTFNLQQVAPDGSGVRTLGVFVAQEGCGGGGIDAAGALYDMETGFYGNGLSLAWTKYGWLYSTSCSGAGLALMNFNNQVVWTAPTLGRATVSPSGASAAAIALNTGLRATTLVTLDLSSGHFTVSNVAPIVDQIGWSADEQTVFYSTITGGQVTLWKVPVQGGTSPTALFADQGSYIGVITTSPDSQMAVFSLISNSNPPAAQMVAVAVGGNPPGSPATLATATVIVQGGRPAFATPITLAAAQPVATPIPTVAPVPPSPVCVVRADWQYTYAVVAGDTVSSIAQRAGITTDMLAQGNCLTNINTIFGGQVFRVPIPVQPGIKRITFSPGGTGAVVQGQVGKFPAIDRWLIRINAGQTLNVQLGFSSGAAILIITGGNGAVLLSSLAHLASVSVVIPTTQDYFIDVSDVSGAGTVYSMTVNVPPVVQPQPPVTTGQRISFSAGAVSAVVSGQTGVNGMSRWVIRILAGQTIKAQLGFVTGNAILIVYGADGTVLQTDHAGSASFIGVVPFTEDYYIDVRDVSGVGTSYSLTVTIPPI